MTAKEKAFELAHKYRLIEIRTSENSFIMISMEDAKKCALIALDEILKGIVPKDDNERYAFELNGNQFYWQEVKKELESL